MYQREARPERGGADSPSTESCGSAPRNKTGKPAARAARPPRTPPRSRAGPSVLAPCATAGRHPSRREPSTNTDAPGRRGRPIGEHVRRTRRAPGTRRDSLCARSARRDEAVAVGQVPRARLWGSLAKRESARANAEQRAHGCHGSATRTTATRRCAGGSVAQAAIVVQRLKPAPERRERSWTAAETERSGTWATSIGALRAAVPSRRVARLRARPARCAARERDTAHRDCRRCSAHRVPAFSSSSASRRPRSSPQRFAVGYRVDRSRSRVSIQFQMSPRGDPAFSDGHPPEETAARARGRDEHRGRARSRRRRPRRPACWASSRNDRARASRACTAPRGTRAAPASRADGAALARTRRRPPRRATRSARRARRAGGTARCPRRRSVRTRDRTAHRGTARGARTRCRYGRRAR